MVGQGKTLFGRLLIQTTDYWQRREGAAVRVDILATESLGVRGLCCVVRTRRRYIVIDPGLALGYLRNGLLPHPRQVGLYLPIYG